jgi:hypothetical protein
MEERFGDFLNVAGHISFDKLLRTNWVNSRENSIIIKNNMFFFVLLWATLERSMVFLSRTYSATADCGGSIMYMGATRDPAHWRETTNREDKTTWKFKTERHCLFIYVIGVLCWNISLSPYTFFNTSVLKNNKILNYILQARIFFSVMTTTKPNLYQLDAFDWTLI